MKHYPLHCLICNTSFDLIEDPHGCCLGVCNCEDVGEDLGLWDTAFFLRYGKYISDYVMEKRRSEGE